MNRKLLIICAAFALGEAIGRLNSKLVMVLSVLGITAAMIMVRRFTVIPFVLEKRKMLYILIGVFLAGTLRGMLCKREDGFYLAVNDSLSCVIQGEIYQVEGGKEKETDYIYIKTKTIDCPDFGNTNNTYKIKVTGLSGEAYNIGQGVQIQGILYKPDAGSNPGEFNAESYYKARGILFLCKGESIIAVDYKKNLYKEALRSLREHFVVIYDTILPETEASIVKAMILGEKAGLDGDIKKLYQENGIAHILAISGLHIAFIGGSLFRFLKKRGLSYGAAGVVGIGFIISYGMLTGLSDATLRAVIMLILSIVGAYLGRSYDMLTGMGIAAFVMLFINPNRLTDAGFLLSFGAIVGMGAVLPVLEGNKKKKSKLRTAFLSSLSVQFVTLPVIVYFYYEIPVYSIFLNMLVIPLLSVAVFCAILGGITGFFWVQGGSLLSYPCVLILKLYAWLCTQIGKLPFATITVGSIKPMHIGVYYAALCLLLLGIHYKKRVLPVGMIFIMGLSIFWKPHDLLIVMIDVGQGDGMFIQTRENATILVDGGSSSNEQVGQYTILPLLEYYGVDTLDYIVVTHGDYDHISGILYLLEPENKAGVEIKHLVIPALGSEDEALNTLADLAKQQEIQVISMKQGDCLKSGGLTLQCLHPSAGYVPDSGNDGSLVLALEYGEFSMLLTGDLETAGEERLLKEGLLKQYQVLKVAHHGSDSSTAQAFLDEIMPVYGLISCGANNRYGHPHEAVINRLAQIQCHILKTPKTGAIIIQVNKKGYRIQGYLPGH